jgi:hypothetical protein
MLNTDSNNTPILGDYLEGTYQLSDGQSSGTSLCSNKDGTIFTGPGGESLINCATNSAYETYSHMAFHILNQHNPLNNCPLVIPTKKLIADACTVPVTPSTICSSSSQFTQKPVGYPSPGAISPYNVANPINN